MTPLDMANLFSVLEWIVPGIIGVAGLVLGWLMLPYLVKGGPRR